MAFSTQCTNKGCGKIQEPYIDKEDDKIYCSECNREITNLTHFAKIQMKSLGQYRQKSKISFAIKCPHCSAEVRPKLTNNDVVCGSCGKPLDNLSLPFKNMLKDKLKTVGKDV